MLTGFFGGSNNQAAITTFNWSSMQYTSHSPELNIDRSDSTCTLLNGDNGEKVVAIAGGRSMGMEAWNPIDQTVKYLTADFPPANHAGCSQMLSIQSGEQLILYKDGEIWNYFQVNNSWVKIGNTIQKRVNFLALPVKKISCN